VYSLKRNIKNIQVKEDDVSAVIKYKSGLVQKREVYYGASFLSQSGRFLTIDNNVISVKVTNSKNQSRNIF
jgi:hypothetical protein